MKTQFLSFIVVVFVILANGCSLLSGSGSCDSDEAEIIFRDGRCDGSIEGIRIGDDTTFVFQTLGKPDGGAIYDIGRLFEYDIEGAPAIGVSIALPSAIVENIAVFGPYPGRTQKDIGLGAKREDVIRAHGKPDKVIMYPPPSSPNQIDWYFFLRNTFLLGYDADTLSSIGMRGAVTD